MTEITSITLENEMDIVVVHKRMMSIGEYLKFTLTTQTAYSTAIAEVSREVIDRVNTGVLTVSLSNHAGKYFLVSRITYTGDVELRASDDGLSYARKLVPEFDLFKDETGGWIELQIGIPKSAKLDPAEALKMREYFKHVPSNSPYELLKERNAELNTIALKRDEELRYSKQVNDMKTEFISVASHELKTPLTTLKAYCELALQLVDAEQDNKMHGYLKKMNDQGNKLQRLIGQLLDLSKVEIGRLDYNKETIPFKSYVQDIINTFSLLYPKHVILLHAENIDIAILIDRLRIEQVFANLLGNAAKYSPVGTNITVHCWQDDKGVTYVSVTDEGIGIADNDALRIFDKFYRSGQVIDRFNGMGMGLYITKTIVEAHGGTIWLESEHGKGATFIFTLPKA